MKFSYKQWVGSGKCAVCGRSTKLLVHSSCGEKMAENNEEAVKARKKWQRRVGKDYKNGHIPPFAKL